MRERKARDDLKAASERCIVHGNRADGSHYSSGAGGARAHTDRKVTVDDSQNVGNGENQSGSGNISEAPHFVNPSQCDYCQVGTSATVDARTNSRVLAADFEGDGLPVDGNLDGDSVVYIGADELGRHASSSIIVQNRQLARHQDRMPLNMHIPVRIFDGNGP